MAHNIDMTNNRANMAFIGSRKDIWHGLGQSMESGMTLEQWSLAAGLNWSAIKVPAIADLKNPQFDHIPQTMRDGIVNGKCFIVRSDNGYPLGFASDSYQPVQPSEILEWFERYISVDPRFQLDTAGSLKRGEIIWAQATFNPDNSSDGFLVNNEKHIARLLMTTTYDCTGSTINKATMQRVVCNNTLDAALADKGKSIVKTRHNTRFDAARVGAELAKIAQGFEAYKAMGEAMNSQEMSKAEISNFFKTLLDIPFDAKSDDVSTRKMNQFHDLIDCYRETVLEGTKPETQWSALNSVTRYVDHARSTRNGDSPEEARVLSSQFGSGAAMKAEAVTLLLERPAKRQNGSMFGGTESSLLDSVLGNTVQ